MSISMGFFVSSIMVRSDIDIDPSNLSSTMVNRLLSLDPAAFRKLKWLSCDRHRFRGA